ncbi:MAG: hypothetical protein JXR03_05105 [Cyclobacteriaceae bacterium]
MSGLSEFYVPPREEKNRLKGCLAMFVFIAAGFIVVMVMFMIVAYLK